MDTHTPGDASGIIGLLEVRTAGAESQRDARMVALRTAEDTMTYRKAAAQGLPSRAADPNWLRPKLPSYNFHDEL